MANDLQTKLDAILADKKANLLPENLKKGITLLGVNGNFEGSGGSGSSTNVPVKLFETVEDMNADTNPEIDDLALVYKNKMENLTSTTTFDMLSFPKTVTLPAAITSEVYAYGYSRNSSSYLDVDGTITSTSCDIRLMGDENYSISYTSTDGITYTRTDTYDDTMSTGEITMMWYEWDNSFGYFMQAMDSNFGGLFKYSTYTDTNSLVFVPISNVSLEVNNGLTNVSFTGEYDNIEYDVSKIGELLNTIKSDTNGSGVTIYQDKNNILHVICTLDSGYYNSLILPVYDMDSSFIGIGTTSTSSITCKQYVIDLENNTITFEKNITTVLSSHYLGYYYLPLTDIKSFPVRYSFSSPANTIVNESVIGYCNGTSSQSYYTVIDEVNHNLEKTNYILAPTQLDSITSDQLQTKYTVYTKNGEVTGSLTAYTKTIAPKTEEIILDNGIYKNSKISAVTKSIDGNIQASNIKEGISILGVEGSLPTVKEHYKAVGVSTPVCNKSSATNFNKSTSFMYTSSDGGAYALGIFDKLGNPVGVITGENKVYVWNDDGTLTNEANMTAPNFKLSGWSSVQSGPVSGVWENNQCKLWYIGYGSSYCRYVYCVTLTKNASGQIVYDSTLPHWRYYVPTVASQSVKAAGIVVNPYNHNKAIVSIDVEQASKYRPAFISLTLNNWTSGQGTMTATGPFDTSTSNGMTDDSRYFTYLANGRLAVYGSGGGVYTSKTIALLLDENSEIMSVYEIPKNVTLFKHDGTKCIVGSSMYDVTVDYTNKTITLSNTKSIGISFDKSCISDIYDNFVLATTKSSYYVKLYKFNWETGARTQLLSLPAYYEPSDIVLYPCGNVMSTAWVTRSSSYGSTAYGSFLFVKSDLELVSVEYKDITYMDTDNGNITSGDVLSGKIAYSDNMEIIGTMPNNGELTYTPGKNAQIIPEGYTSGGTIEGIPYTALTFSTIDEMNTYTNPKEDDYAIVYGTTYVGTYRYDNGNWTQIGDSVQEQDIMNALNDIAGTTDQYEGVGGTDEEISVVLDEILGEGGSV